MSEVEKIDPDAFLLELARAGDYDFSVERKNGTLLYKIGPFSYDLAGEIMNQAIFLNMLVTMLSKWED